MRLVDLLDHWSQEHELTEKEILKAAQKHMFHEDMKLRFIVETSSTGQITIRVTPPRWKRACPTPVRAQAGG